MKVSPDPAQVAGRSAERLGVMRKSWAAITVQTLSKKTTVLKAQIPEDLSQKLRGKIRKGEPFFR